MRLARLEDILKHRDDLDVSLCKENIELYKKDKEYLENYTKKLNII